MSEENIVGSAGILLTPQLDKSGMAAFRSQLRAATSAAARGATRSLRQEFGSLPKLGNIDEEMAKQRIRAQRELRRTTKIYQAEANSWSSLQKQKTRSLAEAASKQKADMAALSRSFDTSLLQMKTALRNGNISQHEYAVGTRKIFTEATAAGLSVDDLARKQAGLARLTGGSFLGNLYKAGSALSQVATRVGMLGYQMQLLGKIMTQFVSLPIAGSLTVASVVGLKQAASIESAMRGMVALNPNKNVVPFFHSMMELAEKSPVFEVGPLLDSIRGLSAAGLDIETLDKVVRAMGNIGMTVGVEPEQMSRAFYAIKQIATKGRVYAEELRQQLGDAIPGIDALLAEGAGITNKQLQKMLEDKKLTASKFFESLINIGNSKRFLEGAATGVNTLQSAWSSFIETTKNNLARQFLTKDLAVKPEIAKGLNDLSDALGKLIKAAGEAGLFDMLIKMFTSFVKAITALVEKYKSLSEAQKKVIPKLALFAAAIGPIMLAVAPLFSMLGMFANTIATVGIVLGGVASPAGAAAASILAVTVGLGALFVVLYTKVEPFRQKMNQGFIELARVFDSYVMPAINDVWTQLVLLGREFKSMGVDWVAVAVVIIGSIKGTMIMLTGLIRMFEASIWMVKLFGTITAVSIGGMLAPIRMLTEVTLGLLNLLEKIPGVGGTGFSGAKEKLQGFQDGIDGFADRLSKVGTENGKVEGSAFSLTGTLGGLSSMFGQNTTSALTLGDAVDNLREKLLGAKNAAGETTSAGDTFKKSQLDLKEAIKANKLTLSDQTRAGLANRDALKAATQASVEKTLADIRAGVPMQEAINKHNQRIKSLRGEFTKTKEVKAAADKLIESYDKIPRDVKTLLEMMGYKDIQGKLLEMSVRQRALKEGKSFDVLWQKEKKLANMNKKGWAGGGWTGPGGRYQPAGIVHRDEHVIKQDSRRRIEKTNPGLLDYINRRGMLPPQYAGGGLVQQWKFPIDVSKTMIKDSWGLPSIAGIVGSGGSGGPGRFQQMFAWIHKMMGGQVHLSSGYRPGDPLLHGQGRAVDLTFPDGSERTGGGLALKAFNLIKSNFFKSITELIWDFAGNQAVWNGQNHFFTGPGAGPGTHNDHIHWAHDNGGPLYDGMLTRNSSGQTETVLNSAQGKAFEERIKGAGYAPEVRVFIGDQELRGIVRVEVQEENRKTTSSLKRGRGR